MISPCGSVLNVVAGALFDAKGRVHWKRTGGDPFTDMDFLLQSLKRMNGTLATTQPSN